MTTADAGPDSSWSDLAALDAEAREAGMRDRYTALAALSEDERRRRMQAMAEAEYALPDELLRVFTVSRLRVWLELDPAVAKQIAGSYDAVMTQMPGPIAMRRVSIVQTLAREFPPEDEERLRELVPAVFAGQPHRVVGGAAPQPAPQPSSAPDPPRRTRPWWAFWRR
jgi:hypothetical protein